MTFSGLFVVLASFGLDVLVAREVAAAPSEGSRYLGVLSLAKAPMALATVLGMVGTSLLLGYSQTVSFYVLLAGVSTIALSYSRFIFGFFRALGALQYEAFISAGDRVVASLLCMGLALVGFGLGEIFFVSATISALTAVASFVILKSRFIPRPVYSLDRTFLTRVCRMAVPLLALAVCSVLYFQIDIVLLSVMKDERVVGLYSAAVRLLSLFQFIPGAVIGTLFPLMSREFVNARWVQLSKTAWTGLRAMFLVGSAAAAIIYVSAGEIVKFLFAEGFDGSVIVVQILIWALPPFLINPILGNLLIATRNPNQPTVSVLAAGVLNVGLNVVLIPRYGLVGAASASVLCEWFLAVAQTYFALPILCAANLGETPGGLGASWRHLRGLKK